ncbi:MAG: PhzF family phenazine biosynthesis protein [Rhodospirillaceae bacterium]|nr:PhzF family phenazine biosynthesis protein [Rhodospirillaceae bacterium]
MQRRYAVLDVFTATPLAGNPLAVVLDSDGLDDDRMQAIAAEFNLSETVFVRPPERPVHSAAIRIFTPKRELDFAGHPTIGTAILLALAAAEENHNKHEMMMVLEEKIGPVRCGVSLKDDMTGHAVFDLLRLPEETGDLIGREAAALALDLTPGEIGFENHQPSAFSAGTPFAYVPVRDLETIARARVNRAAWQTAFGETLLGAYVYCRETAEAGHHFHARMFAPAAGIAEDPATGAAVAGLAGVIRHFDQPAGGAHHYVVEQGFEMARPSLLTLEVDMNDGRIEGARIGGDAVVLARGTFAA